ncbi:MAG: DUF499 domain-containing protein [Holophagales bacterium]|jgi:hypothetical protein|nr:DUF499 domain-containing protein [Holophagales bacterium]
MLNLALRQEFASDIFKGSAVDLSTDSDASAIKRGAGAFLKITYPTLDILKALQAAGNGEGRPIMVIGERGFGKSHLMAALYFAFENPDETKDWLDMWAKDHGLSDCARISLPPKMQVICEVMHTHKYKTLWELIFKRCEKGPIYNDRWEQMGAGKTAVPPKAIIQELFDKEPTALILDEMQTWYETLDEGKENEKGKAFNFLQILSEIATERPNSLRLAVSVRNGNNEVYKQIQRNSPIMVDFKAGGKLEAITTDRRRMLLHRLFENRNTIGESEIHSAIRVHLSELFRLQGTPAANQEALKNDYIVSWPFSSKLLGILEEEVLVRATGQGTRDLIKILSSLYRSCPNACIITAADMMLDQDIGTVASMLDAVDYMPSRNLREKAKQNIVSVKQVFSGGLGKVPHLVEIVSALWLRSLSSGNQRGATPKELQADITKEAPIDDNAFFEEIGAIKDNSYNIHEDGNKLLFREDENPKARLLATARNDRMFEDGSDKAYLAKEIKHVLFGPGALGLGYDINVLPPNWVAAPLAQMEDGQAWPGRDDRLLPLAVLPETPENIGSSLGNWLKNNVAQRRNTVRFLLPKAGIASLYEDPKIKELARAAMLGEAWSTNGKKGEYYTLSEYFQKALREEIKRAYGRVALLEKWSFENPASCEFNIVSMDVQADKILAALEAKIKGNYFEPEDFEALAQQVADDSGTLARLVNDLQNPRPNGQRCIPWLGINEVREHLAMLCSKGKIAIQPKGGGVLQRAPGEDEKDALKRIKPKLFDPSPLEETYLMKPISTPATGGAPNQAGQSGGEDSPLFLPPAPNVIGGTASATVTTTGPATPTVTRAPVHKECPATSPLNLLGNMETWGVMPNSITEKITLSISCATGAQLKEIIKKLPEDSSCELKLYIRAKD